MKILRQLLYFLTHSEKKKACVLLFLTLLMAFIDVLGVASILPFMSVITNPTLIQTNIILSSMFDLSTVIGVKTTEQFIVMLSVLMFLILIFSLLIKTLAVYLQSRFVQMREYSISKLLTETYLHQPYSWFLNRNSSELGTTILSETTMIVKQGIAPMFNFITQSIIAISLLIFLLLIDLKLTLTAFLVIGLSYFLIYKFFHLLLGRIGKERLQANESRFKFVSEAFSALKEIKVNRLESVFIKKFSNSSEIYAKHQATSQIISRLPRYAIEAIIFGGMLLLLSYVTFRSGNFVNAVPIISVYAFAGYRLIPSLQQIYVASIALKFSKPSINKIYNELKNLKIHKLSEDKNILHFNKSIVLNNVHYNYPNSSRTALSSISMNIPFRNSVGIIGPTGSGKTTIIDIILGLLEPRQGTLEIDGKVITKNNIKNWQSYIGFVPQQIYLSDDTIASNVAFGVDTQDINYQLVEEVSKIANLHEFVIDELPKQYQTVVGERGIRLSGGQRQRIGIARALYHNPKVLILDEATNSLDNFTEKDVMQAINNIRKEMTLIIITHRLSTVKNCDKIFKLEKGQIII